MRKLLLVVCSVLLCAAVAAAQASLTSQWKCAKVTGAHSFDVGDQPNHSYSLNQINCSSIKGEVGGVREKDGAGTEFHDNAGNTSTSHGVFVVTAANGDKLHYSYKSVGTMAGENFQSGSNTWSIIGGTGKFKGAKGSGSCNGKGSPDGSSMWDCKGNYTLAK